MDKMPEPYFERIVNACLDWHEYRARPFNSISLPNRGHYGDDVLATVGIAMRDVDLLRNLGLTIREAWLQVAYPHEIHEVCREVLWRWTALEQAHEQLGRPPSSDLFDWWNPARVERRLQWVESRLRRAISTPGDEFTDVALLVAMRKTLVDAAADAADAQANYYGVQA